MPRWHHPRGSIAVWMSLAFLALLPFGGLYNVPLLVLCGLGLLRLASRPREAFGNDGLRLLLVLFLCIWLPMTIAAIDAVNPVHAWRKVGSFLVLFLAGAYVAMALRRGADLQRLLVGVLVICVFWSVDATWQFIHGFNLLGFPYEGGRVPGIFHPDLKLGIVLLRPDCVAVRLRGDAQARGTKHMGIAGADPVLCDDCLVRKPIVVDRASRRVGRLWLVPAPMGRSAADARPGCPARGGGRGARLRGTRLLLSTSGRSNAGTAVRTHYTGCRFRQGRPSIFPRCAPCTAYILAERGAGYSATIG